MNLHWLDVATLLIYLGGMAAMGVYFSRKNTNTEEYFVGGRSFAGWAIGLSLVGTSISSVTFLAYPGDAFKTAWLRYIPNFMLPVGVFIAAYVFLPFFRRGKITSAYQYLEGRFGPSVRVYGSLAFIVGQLFRVSIILYLVSLVVHEMTGLDSTTCILIGGIFVALYTILGGIDAVIWTDVIQTIVLVLGGVVCLGVIVSKLPGGMGQIFSVAAAEGKFAFAELVDGKLEPVSWGLSLQHKTGTMMLLLGLTAWLTEYSGNQNVIQRYCASRSVGEARKAMFVCAFSSVPIWAFFMFLGTSLFVFFKAFPTVEATEMLTGARKAEQVLPFFIMHHLPPGITGLVIAAALAAAMSSLDSSINAIATSGVTDIYRRHLVKDRDDRHYLRVAWAIATAAAVFMIAGAIVLGRTETKTLQDTATIIGSLLAGGLLGMYLLGFLTTRGDARAVWIGIACTLLFTGWTVASDKQLAALELGAGDVLDWPAFCRQLSAEGKADRSGTSRRLWESLPEESRAAIAATAEGAKLDKKRQAKLAKELDALLKRGDLYRANDFEDIPLPARLSDLLAREPASLTPRDRRRLHRGLLEAAYPTTINKSLRLLPDALIVPFDLYYTRIFGNLLMFVVGYLAALLLPRRPRSLTNLTVWQQDGTPLE